MDDGSATNNIVKMKLVAVSVEGIESTSHDILKMLPNDEKEVLAGYRVMRREKKLAMLNYFKSFYLR